VSVLAPRAAPDRQRAVWAARPDDGVLKRNEDKTMPGGQSGAYRDHGRLIGGGVHIDRLQNTDLARLGVDDIAVAPFSDVGCVNHDLSLPGRHAWRS
jgi:hypothetical protein